MAKKKICYIPWEGTPKDIFENDIGNWEYKLKKELEKENIEIDLYDNLEIENSDGCILFDNIFYKNLDAIWKMYNSKLLHKSIYIDYEPQSGHCRNHDARGIKELSNIFKNVITYNDDFIDNHRIIKGNIGNFYSKEKTKPLEFKNKKFIVMVTNNTSIKQIRDTLNYYNRTCYYNEKTLKNYRYAIYHKREEAAKYFLNKCSDKFDLYGVLWNEEFKPVLKGFLDKKLKIETLVNTNLL